MAKHYKFGMSVDNVQPKPEHPDFDVYSKSTSSDTERPNPYGNAWFDDVNTANISLEFRKGNTSQRVFSEASLIQIHYGF